MMKVRLFLCVLVGLLVFSGCSKETFEEHKPAQAHEFKLKKNDITTDYRKGFEYVYLDTDMAITWTAASSADWLIVTPTSGTGGANICVTWQENTEPSNREATVTITTPQRSALTLTVKQGEKPAELLGARAIVGNVIQGERDSVELVFDKPVGKVNVSSSSEL